ncbi:sensor histidine kinase [Kosmotoga arenicorallina]|uniref:sensor histidine kinase n=1 Tax=Kosmotoga arenicorallina TaxID=688066 RepID=UPI000A0665A3|nr:ATP-binding protein [Kosmotoga arenicorallina]
MLYAITIMAALLALLFFRFLACRKALTRFVKIKHRIAQLTGLDERAEIISIYDALRKLINDKDKNIEMLTWKVKYMQNVLDNMTEAFFIIDENGKIEYINNAVKKITGTSDIIGKKLTDVLNNFFINDLYEEMIETKQPQHSEITLFGAYREYFVCEMIPVSHAGVNHALVILRNITNEKQLEAIRREFVSDVSHELRTPLTSIHGYAETLLDHDLSDKETVRHFLNIIEKESARMTRLINDLLDVEKLESGDAKFAITDVELTEVGRYVLKIIGPLADELGVKVMDDIEEGIFVEGDFDRLVQLTLNLVDNAVKYTAVKEHGPKEVWLRIYALANFAFIEVEDTGVGIPEEAQKRIFERFFRVDKARSRKMGGTGLGLAIVKFIADKLNGKVELESEYGSGTTFRVKIPLKKVIK